MGNASEINVENGNILENLKEVNVKKGGGGEESGYELFLLCFLELCNLSIIGSSHIIGTRSNSVGLTTCRSRRQQQL